MFTGRSLVYNSDNVTSIVIERTVIAIYRCEFLPSERTWTCCAKQRPSSASESIGRLEGRIDWECRRKGGGISVSEETEWTRTNFLFYA